MEDKAMKLEQQLAKLAEFDLTLNEGIGVDDLLSLHERQAYEEKPFQLLIQVLGTEVERGSERRPICLPVWDFHYECFAQTGDYVAIVKRFSDATGQSHRFTEIEDFVDLEAGVAWLKYQLDGNLVEHNIDVKGSVADPRIIAYIMGDVEADGYMFYDVAEFKSTSLMIYLDDSKPDELENLTGYTLIL